MTPEKFKRLLLSENPSQLPQGLAVGGDLSLSGCTGLTQLPQGLAVEGNLFLSGCTGLTQLPQGHT